MTPEEVHQLGLSQVAEYTGLIDGILKSNGFTTVASASALPH